MKAKLKIVMIVVAFLCFGIVTSTVHAQSLQNPLPNWLTWNALLVYLAVGAFFGILHDINDKQGQIIMPHKVTTPTGTSWDLGVITPALFGAFSGFFGVAVANTPFLNALFPTLGSPQFAGALAAAFGGYFYTKTIQVISSTMNGTSTGSTPPAATTPPPTTPAPPPSTTSTLYASEVVPPPAQIPGLGPGVIGLKDGTWAVGENTPFYKVFKLQSDAQTYYAIVVFPAIQATAKPLFPAAPQ